MAPITSGLLGFDLNCRVWVVVWSAMETCRTAGHRLHRKSVLLYLESHNRTSGRPGNASTLKDRAAGWAASRAPRQRLRAARVCLRPSRGLVPPGCPSRLAPPAGTHGCCPCCAETNLPRLLFTKHASAKGVRFLQQPLPAGAGDLAFGIEPESGGDSEHGGPRGQNARLAVTGRDREAHRQHRCWAGLLSVLHL